MKLRGCIGWSLLAICMSLAGGFVLLVILFPAEQKPHLHTEFKESSRLVKNPDCGWIAYNYEDSYEIRKKAAGGDEPFALASVVYTRHPRNQWGSPGGNLGQSAPVKLLEDWIAHERHVAFRVYANHVDHLPAGLQTEVETVGSDRKGIAYWDEDYVEDHARLVHELGDRFGDSPYLAFVDIGGVGDTGGEWYLSEERYSGAGLDDEDVYQLAKRFVKMYEAAFPQTRLFISYDCVLQAGNMGDELRDFLVEHDIGARDDGLGGWPYPKTHTLVTEWPLPYFWSDVPLCFEGSGTGGGVYGWTLQDKDPEHVLSWIFRHCPPSYINMGGSETASTKAKAQLRPLLLRYGRRLGYRFALLKVSCPSVFRTSGESVILMWWANRGSAPCYEDHKIEVSLFDSAGKLVATVANEPDWATTKWSPETEQFVRLPFTVPADVPQGQYTLKVRMLLGDPRAPDRALEVATQGADQNGRFTVGKVEVRN